MKFNRVPLFDAKLLIALALIVVGALTLAQNLGAYIDFNIWEWWPLILILIGIGQLFQPGGSRDLIGGAVLILVGGLLLASNLMRDFEFGWSQIWPVLVILLGIKLLRQSFWLGLQSVDHDRINLTTFLGGGDFIYSSRHLHGGHVTTVMGGAKLDFRQADMSDDEMTLDLFTIWGGIEILVPAHWKVNLEATPIMGGVENKFTEESGQSLVVNGTAATKHLRITGLAIMGAIEVKM